LIPPARRRPRAPLASPDFLQEPSLPDDVRLPPNPLPGLVAVNLSEEPGAFPRRQLPRPIAHEAEGLEVKLGRSQEGKAAEENPALADDGLEELLVEGFALLRAVED